MIRPLKPLTSRVCGSSLILVGEDESVISNGHWAVRIDNLREGILVKSPEYVRAVLGAKLDKMPGSSFERMMTRTRTPNKPVVQWYDTGWRNSRGKPLAAFATVDMPTDHTSTRDYQMACFDPTYVSFFGVDSLWGVDREDLFTDREMPGEVSFILMPVHSRDWVGPLVRLLTAHPELAK